MVDVRADGLPGGLLDRAFEQFGAAVLNTRSTTWRGLSDAEKAGDPTALINTHPALMKRPLIAVDGSLFLGWNKEIEQGVHALL